MVVLGAKEFINSTDSMYHCWNAIKSITLSMRFFLGGLSQFLSTIHTDTATVIMIYMTVSGAEQKYLFSNQSKAKVKHDQVW